MESSHSVGFFLFYFLLISGRKSDTTSFGIAQRRTVVLYVWLGAVGSSQHVALMGPSSPLKGGTQSWVALLCPMVALRGWHGREGFASHRAISSTETSRGPSQGTWTSETCPFFFFFTFFMSAQYGTLGDALSSFLARSGSTALQGGKPQSSWSI